MSREPAVRPVLVASPAGWWRGTPEDRGRAEGRAPEDASAALAGPVTLALGRRSVFVRSTSVPPASPAQTAAALALRLPQLVPLPAGQAAWAHEVVAAEGERLAVVLAASAEGLEAFRRDAQTGRARVAQVAAVALGSAAICRKLGLPDAVVVERTPEGLGLDVVRRGHLVYSRSAVVDDDPGRIRAEIVRTLAAAGIGELPVVAAGGFAWPEAYRSVAESAAEALAASPLSPALALETPAAAAAARKRREQGRFRVAFLMAAAAVMLNLMVAWDRMDAGDAVRADEARWRDEQRRLRNARDAAAKAASDAARIADPLRRAFAPAQRPSDVLVVVGNLAPDGAWLTGATIERGKPLQIRGTATDNPTVAGYVERLAAQDRLRDVRLVFANGSTVDETPVVNFAIAATAVGNLPLVDARAARAARARASSSGASGGGR